MWTPPPGAAVEAADAGDAAAAAAAGAAFSRSELPLLELGVVA